MAVTVDSHVAEALVVLVLLPNLIRGFLRRDILTLCGIVRAIDKLTVAVDDVGILPRLTLLAGGGGAGAKLSPLLGQGPLLLLALLETLGILQPPLRFERLRLCIVLPDGLCETVDFLVARAGHTDSRTVVIGEETGGGGVRHGLPALPIQRFSRFGTAVHVGLVQGLVALVGRGIRE